MLSQVLKGVSFVVEPGQTVAFVGGSGSGKSTIFSLLERFYQLPNPKGGNNSTRQQNNNCGGTITIDGKPLESYNVGTLRRILGVVEQEPKLFGTTIRNNMLLGLRCNGGGLEWEGPADDENTKSKAKSKSKSKQTDKAKAKKDKDVEKAANDTQAALQRQIEEVSKKCIHKAHTPRACSCCCVLVNS